MSACHSVERAGAAKCDRLEGFHQGVDFDEAERPESPSVVQRTQSVAAPTAPPATSSRIDERDTRASGSGLAFLPSPEGASGSGLAFCLHQKRTAPARSPRRRACRCLESIVDHAPESLPDEIPSWQLRGRHKSKPRRTNRGTAGLSDGKRQDLTSRPRRDRCHGRNRTRGGTCRSSREPAELKTPLRLLLSTAIFYCRADARSGKGQDGIPQ